MMAIIGRWVAITQCTQATVNPRKGWRGAAQAPKKKDQTIRANDLD
jgi:hypothetical protein